MKAAVMPACPLLDPQGPARFRGPELVSARLNQSGGDTRQERNPGWREKKTVRPGCSLRNTGSEGEIQAAEGEGTADGSSFGPGKAWSRL